MCDNLLYSEETDTIMMQIISSKDELVLLKILKLYFSQNKNKNANHLFWKVIKKINMAVKLNKADD